MKSAVITGATSMIGVALVKECIKNNVKVLAIVRKNSKHRNRIPKSEFVKVCEAGLEELEQIFEAEYYDVFYHLAWTGTSKSERDNPIIQEKNIAYTLQAVELAHRLGCKKFVGAGSQAEYGKVDGVILPEMRVAPVLAYGVAKYAAGKFSEKLCREYSMIHVWARIFSVYGCLDNERTMLNYAIDCFKENGIPKFSAATQMWDYLYEEDAGKIFYLLGKCVEKSKVYCVANGNARPLKEYILELQNAWGNAKCEFASENSDEVIGLQADITELIDDIGYTPATEFCDGIKKVVEYKKMQKSAGINNGMTLLENI